MNTINIEKRFEERLAVIRKVAESLPESGKRLSILNNCAKLSKYAQVAGKQLQTAHYRHANYDARTDVDFANYATQRKKIWAALLAGRRVSIEMEDEVGHMEFHTRISEIRNEIRDKNLPYELCDEWFHPGEGRSKYKKYWLEPKLEKEVEG
jgi:hypothetical protein